MSINDLLVTGATPIAFLDYLAVDKLNLDVHIDVVKGISEGCRIAGCTLIGGETAELPGFYRKEEYDLAGFAVGIVEKSNILKSENVRQGDVLIGLPSSGIHSNGYSLVRKVFSEFFVSHSLNQILPGLKKPLGQTLLAPTKIYANEFSLIKGCNGIRAAAHITGGGIPGNIPRVLPRGLGAVFHKDSWPVPPVFKLLEKRGNIRIEEMYNVFNMGLGMIWICSPEGADSVQDSLSEHGYESFIVGQVEQGGGVRFQEKPRSTCPPIEKSKERHPKLRLAILGSGRGSNMESICTAIEKGHLHAEITCVVSNNSRAYILERAENRGIATYHISNHTHADADSYNAALLDVFSRHNVDLICLAGYMKLIHPEITRQYRNRILNIHPALLPAFGGKGMYGLHVHKAVLNSGAKYSGVTIHLVNDEYDKGSIIAQDIVPVDPDDTPQTLGEKVLKIEHTLYWETIRNYSKEIRK